MMGTNPITFNVPAAGKYYLQLHCGGTYSLDGYKFKVSGLINNIEDQHTNNFAFQFFPNPVSDKLTLQFNQSQQENLSLAIYNVSGQLVQTKILNQNQPVIDVSGLAEGVYMLELKSEGLSGKQKLIIER